MSDYVVESIEWTTASRALLSYRPEPILSAVLSVGGHSLHVSSYPDELRPDGTPYWSADAHFTPTGAPAFCHGLGSRCTDKQVLSDDVAATLNARTPDQPV
jgi:hypothetical protein